MLKIKKLNLHLIIIALCFSFSFFFGLTETKALTQEDFSSCFSGSLPSQFKNSLYSDDEYDLSDYPYIYITLYNINSNVQSFSLRAFENEPHFLNGSPITLVDYVLEGSSLSRYNGLYSSCSNSSLSWSTPKMFEWEFSNKQWNRQVASQTLKNWSGWSSFESTFPINSQTIVYSSFALKDENNNIFYEATEELESRKSITFPLADLVDENGNFVPKYFLYLPDNHYKFTYNGYVHFKDGGNSVLSNDDLKLHVEFIDGLLDYNTVQSHNLPDYFSYSGSVISNGLAWPNSYTKNFLPGDLLADSVRYGAFRFRFDDSAVWDKTSLDGHYVTFTYSGIVTQDYSEIRQYYLDNFFAFNPDEVYDDQFVTVGDLFDLFDKFFKNYDSSIEFAKKCMQLFINSISASMLMCIMVIILALAVLGFLK